MSDDLFYLIPSLYVCYACACIFVFVFLLQIRPLLVMIMNDTWFRTDSTVLRRLCSWPVGEVHNCIVAFLCCPSGDVDIDAVL